jgi:hypothetical protein
MCRYSHEDISQYDAKLDIVAQKDIQTGGWRNLYNFSRILSTAWEHYWDSQGKEGEMGRELGTHIENINAYNDLESKVVVKRLLTGSRHTWEDNIKIDVKEIGRERELHWFVVRKEEVALCCGFNKEILL